MILRIFFKSWFLYLSVQTWHSRIRMHFCGHSPIFLLKIMRFFLLGKRWLIPGDEVHALFFRAAQGQTKTATVVSANRFLDNLTPKRQPRPHCDASKQSPVVGCPWLRTRNRYFKLTCTVPEANTCFFSMFCSNVYKGCVECARGLCHYFISVYVQVSWKHG